MRRILFAIVCIECIVLLGGAGLHLTGGLDRFARPSPRAPVFRPPIHQAVIGDTVRYERRDPNGRVLGYLTYKVETAVEFSGTNLGREFVIALTLTDKRDKRDKRTRRRRIRLRPRAVGHGFLPPRFEEDDGYPQGARPVVKTLRSAKVQIFRKGVDGFLLEAVTPRVDLSEVSERFWITDEVPIFGVARWERPGETLVLHTMEKMRP